jgi:hypothetical protein
MARWRRLAQLILPPSLSNLHDQAWLSGSNEYVMSDDPTFKPNAQLNGDWTSLPPLRAQP